MKKINFTILLALIAISCIGCGQTSSTDDDADWVLIRKEYTDKDNEEYSSITKYEYNENGLCTSGELTIVTEDQPSYRYEYQYDEHGNQVLQTTITYDENMNIDHTTAFMDEYEYNEDDTVALIAHYTDNEYQYSEKYEYNSDGTTKLKQTMTEYYRTADGESYDKTDVEENYLYEYEYDDAGNMIRMTTSHPITGIGAYDEYTYDKKGRKESESKYIAANDVAMKTSTTKYKYEKDGHSYTEIGYTGDTVFSETKYTYEKLEDYLKENN